MNKYLKRLNKKTPSLHRLLSHMMTIKEMRDAFQSHLPHLNDIHGYDRARHGYDRARDFLSSHSLRDVPHYMKDKLHLSDMSFHRPFRRSNLGLLAGLGIGLAIWSILKED